MLLLLKFVGILCLAAAVMAAAYYYPTWSAPREMTISGVVEIQEVHLGSKLGGRVAEVLVKEGDRAEPGQVLVTFETPELQAQHQQQVSRVTWAEANLQKAKNGSREEEIRQAKSDLESTQADLTLAEKDLVRFEKLYQDKTITRAEYESAMASQKRMIGKVASAKAHYDLLYAGTRPEDIALAEASLIESRGKLKEIEANLAESKVIAPERCLIEVISVRKGDLVPPNQPVVRVLRVDDMWVKAYVPETRLGEVRLHQQVTVTIDSYPHRKFTGTIYLISSESEFTPRNIQSADERRYQVFGVKIRVDDPEGIFKSGMSATVVFDEKHDPQHTPSVTNR